MYTKWLREFRKWLADDSKWCKMIASAEQIVQQWSKTHKHDRMIRNWSYFPRPSQTMKRSQWSKWTIFVHFLLCQNGRVNPKNCHKDPPRVPEPEPAMLPPTTPSSPSSAPQGVAGRGSGSGPPGFPTAGVAARAEGRPPWASGKSQKNAVVYDEFWWYAWEIPPKKGIIWIIFDRSMRMNAKFFLAELKVNMLATTCTTNQDSSHVHLIH